MWTAPTSRRIFALSVARVNMKYFLLKDSRVARVNKTSIEWRLFGMSRTTTYHHENLRETLLSAAISLIGEVGPAAFTLREVARRAGVSHNAPYRHFRNRDDLVAAVASEGFRELARAMHAATEKQNNALARLKHAGLAYVGFALRKPEHFTVMFDVPRSEDLSSEAAIAAKEAFSELSLLVRAVQADGHFARIDAQQQTLYAWSTVHGIAKLATAGRLPYRTKSGIMNFAAFVIDQSLAGG